MHCGAEHLGPSAHLQLGQREGSRLLKLLFLGNFLSPTLPLIHTVLGFHDHFVTNPVFIFKEGHQRLRILIPCPRLLAQLEARPGLNLLSWWLWY